MSDSSLCTCTSLSPREFACMTGAKYFKSNNSILIQTFLSRTAVYQGGVLYQSVQQIKKDTNGIFMTIFLWWLKHKTNFDTDIWMQLSILFAQDMLGYFASIQYWYNETKKKEGNCWKWLTRALSQQLEPLYTRIPSSGSRGKPAKSGSSGGLDCDWAGFLASKRN